MANVLIFAGGVGSRMNSNDIPKQFLKVDGEPIIIRTLRHFERHPQVEKVVVVCLESWIDELKNELQEYMINKVVAILPGGQTGFQSIHLGLEFFRNNMRLDDIILICDGVRPCLSSKLISDCIDNVSVYRSAVPVTPSIDSVLYSEDGISCSKNITRKKIYITQAPQGYYLKDVLEAHTEAIERGVEAVSTADLFIELGKEVHLFPGIRENIKVTTTEDLHSLRATQYYEHFRTFALEEANNI